MARSLVVIVLFGLACSRSADQAPPPRGSATAQVPMPVRDAGGSADEAADPGDARDDGSGDAGDADVAARSKVLQLVVVGRVACARRADGRVRCWGRQVDGTRAPTHAAPVELPGLIDAVALDHALAGALYVVTGDGTLLRGTLELATQAALTEVSGVTDAVDVRITGEDAVVLTRTGNVHLASTGDRIASDVVALATSVDGGVQLLARDGGVRQWRAGTLTSVRGLDDAVDLFGDRCARRRGGQVACWNRDGRAVRWDGPANISDRVAGARFRCDLTASGVACAGANEVGQLGTGPGPDREAARTVELPGEAIALSAGERSACAVLETGEVACWGANEAGQLGDGTLVDRAMPVLVPGLTTPAPPPPSDGTRAVEQASVAMDWTGMPAGCTRPTSLVGPGDERIRDVRSAYAYTSADGVRVWLADFPLEPGGYRERPTRAAQLAFELRLARGANKRRSQPIDRGRYRDRGPRRATLTIHHGEGRRTYDELDLVVEKVDRTWICGQLLDPADPARRQPFAARFQPRTR